MVLQSRISRRSLITGAGSLAVFAVVGRSSQSRAAGESVTVDDRGVFLDPDSIHSIDIAFAQADYDAVIEDYRTLGEKSWMEATVSIDGFEYPQSGIRLKGNSSLMMLGNGNTGRGGTQSTDSTSMSAPETLPWLIRLNKFVKGQKHQDLERLVIRSNNSASSLNEAVALDLLNEAGLNAQRAAYTSFSVNGSSATLRLAIEEPAKEWLEAHFPNGGPLFKSEAGGDWSYRGTLPDDYIDIFDLEAGESGDDAADYGYLAGFLDFVNNTDDETFVADLETRLDVEKFANYLAMMDLVQNADDIDGPGNNSYVFFDASSSQATVVPWDMNLAFGGLGGMGTGGRPGESNGTPPNSFFQAEEGATPSADQTFPDTLEESDVDVPAMANSPQFGQRPGNGGMGGGMMGGRSNPLVERFTANDSFNALHTAATATLREALFAGGIAETILDRWATLLISEGGALIDTATVESESTAIRGAFTES